MQAARKVVKVTVTYVGPAFGERQHWTEYVSIPADASSDKLATRCLNAMKRRGLATLGVTYQVQQSADLLSAIIADAR